MEWRQSHLGTGTWYLVYWRKTNLQVSRMLRSNSYHGTYCFMAPMPYCEYRTPVRGRFGGGNNEEPTGNNQNETNKHDTGVKKLYANDLYSFFRSIVNE